MRLTVILTTVVLVIAVGFLVASAVFVNEATGKMNSILDSNVSLKNKITELEQKTTIRSFDSEDSLRIWLGRNDRNITMKDKYPSEVALALIKDAREEGYYMGITGYFEINSVTRDVIGTYGKYLVTLDVATANKVGDPMGKIICNTAIVGDGKIYLVYPMEDRIEYLCQVSKSK